MPGALQPVPPHRCTPDHSLEGERVRGSGHYFRRTPAHAAAGIGRATVKAGQPQFVGFTGVAVTRSSARHNSSVVASRAGELSTGASSLVRTWRNKGLAVGKLRMR
jgi:hypothetical protein